METKDFSIKIKALEETGHFTAFAAIYGERDMQNDVIERGAFNRAIGQQGDGFPLLWAHRADTPIGRVTLADSERGPIVSGQIDRDDPDGETAYSRAKKGIVRGVSIGYSLPNLDGVKWHGDTRHIHELRLHELSLVAVPAQPGAVITSVKTLGDVARALDRFDASQLDPSAHAALEVLEKHVRRLRRDQPAEAGLLSELRGIAASMRTH